MPMKITKSEVSTLKKPSSKVQKQPEIIQDHLVNPPNPIPMEVENVKAATEIAKLTRLRQAQLIEQNISDKAILDENVKLAKPITDALKTQTERMEAAENDPANIRNVRIEALRAQITETINAIKAASDISKADQASLLAEVTNLTTAVKESSSADKVADVSNKLDLIASSLDQVSENTKVKSAEEKQAEKDKAKAEKLMKRESKPMWNEFVKHAADFNLDKVDKGQGYVIGDGVTMTKMRDSNGVTIKHDGKTQSFPIDVGFYSVMRALSGSNIEDPIGDSSLKLAKHLVSLSLIRTEQLPDEYDTADDEDEDNVDVKSASSAPIGDPKGEGLKKKSTEAKYYLGETDFKNGLIKVYKEQKPGVRAKAIYTAPISDDLMELLSNKRTPRGKVYSPESVAIFKKLYEYIPTYMKLGRQSTKYAMIHGKELPKSKATHIKIPLDVESQAMMLDKNIAAIGVGNTNAMLKRKSHAIIDSLASQGHLDASDADYYRSLVDKV